MRRPSDLPSGILIIMMFLCGPISHCFSLTLEILKTLKMGIAMQHIRNSSTEQFFYVFEVKSRKKTQNFIKSQKSNPAFVSFVVFVFVFQLYPVESQSPQEMVRLLVMSSL